MIIKGLEITYMVISPRRYTFENKDVREWVEKNCQGRVLNLFAGKTLLNVQPSPVRVDLDPEMIAEYYLDALDFIRMWRNEKKPLFDTIVLDPPYSLRKSMELYKGKKVSSFQKIKEELIYILASAGRVITFGYSSTGMGWMRGFKKKSLLIMNHTGAYHETYGTIDEYLFKDNKDMVAVTEDLRSRKLTDYMQEV